MEIDLVALHSRLKKLTAMAKDPGASAQERKIAREKAAKVQQQISETTPGPGLVAYKTLVEEGKAASLKLGEVNWILGELASKVEKRYGEASLQQYAEDIEVKYSTLKDCRTTYLRWPRLASRPAFSIARVLNSHPERLEIVQQQPFITKRQAEFKVRQYKQERKNKAKPNGKTGENPDPVSEVSSFVLLIDGLLAKGSDLQICIANGKLSGEERMKVTKALEELTKRIADQLKRLK